MRLILALILSAFACSAQTNFYISTTGNDAGTGTIVDPFLTLEGAQTAIQVLRSGTGLPTNGVIVNLRSGRYYRQTAFSLSGTNDSGEVGAPIVWKSYPGEIAYLIGGLVVTNFQSVTNAATLARLTDSAKTNVQQANLTAQGITNLGTLISHGCWHTNYNSANSSTLWQSELLFQDQAMQLARWPNGAWLQTVTNSVITNLNNYNAFGYTGTNPTNWSDRTDIWAHGYWYYDWADSLEHVDTIDTSNKVVTLTVPGVNSWIATGRHFYFFNILEELDSAGEYYIDRTNGMLYFWPPSTMTNGSCIVSTVSSNIVVLTGVSNVTFSGIRFEAAKLSLVNINGGQSNTVSNCSFRGGSADGVKIIFSSGTKVVSCVLSDLGELGVWIYGSGDRTNLVSGNNSITYNTISNISRLARANKPAIGLSHTYYQASENVCGCYIAHNLIHDIPHQAIGFEGNDHLIEYNEFYNICNETADAGVIYAGYNWTYRGNVIRYNYFHDCHTKSPATDFTGVNGVYGDQFMSGLFIYGNVFAAVDHGVLLGGGRDNIIQNNIFVDCTNTYARIGTVLWIDQRGTAGYIDETTNLNSSLWQRYYDMPVTNALWVSRYPLLQTIPTNYPQLAWNNVMATNISYNNLSFGYYEQNANTNTTVVNNLTNSDPLFVDYAARDFNLQAGSPAWALGWQRIPLECIGPVVCGGVGANSSVGRIGTMRMAQ